MSIKDLSEKSFQALKNYRQLYKEELFLFTKNSSPHRYSKLITLYIVVLLLEEIVAKKIPFHYIRYKVAISTYKGNLLLEGSLPNLELSQVLLICEFVKITMQEVLNNISANLENIKERKYFL